MSVLLIWRASRALNSPSIDHPAGLVLRAKGRLDDLAFSISLQLLWFDRSSPDGTEQICLSAQPAEYCTRRLNQHIAHI